MALQKLHHRARRLLQQYPPNPEAPWTASRSAYWGTPAAKALARGFAESKFLIPPAAPAITSPKIFSW
jgi:hypothetical protein